MRTQRSLHYNFLEDELKAQTSNFNARLATKASFLLLEREELFVAQFLGFKDGIMILKFPRTRGLPRTGEYLYCFTVPKELRNYRNWENRTYGDLIKEKANFTETVCVWQGPLRDENGNIESNYCLAGFRGIGSEFYNNIAEAEKMILLLGPNKPPYEYLENLQKIVRNNFSERINQILDEDFEKKNLEPILINGKDDVSTFILDQLYFSDEIILIGPPGTGKTYQIAEICKKICEMGKSVLVTALTNRALMEVAEKPALNELLRLGHVSKTAISTDEARQLPTLNLSKQVSPQPGKLILSTFFIASGGLNEITDVQPFDYVIVDEASQALLAMFAIAKLLGRKNIWIGDTKQLPPVAELNEDKISNKNYMPFVEGLKTLTSTASIPIYQLTETYRLTKRGADYTGLFYNNSLKSKSKHDGSFVGSQLTHEVAKFFNPLGGPTLIKTPLEVGNRKPLPALQIATLLVANLLSVDKNQSIAVLSNFIDTVKELQKSIFQTIGNHKNLLVETVARIQGLTTDVTIFVIPNSGYNRSLYKALFNVATSRAKKHTIIISDIGVITSYPRLNNDVRTYLEKLNEEFSFDWDLKKVNYLSEGISKLKRD